MAYSTVTDIKKLIPEETLIQLTDDEGAGIVNQGRIDEAIEGADGEIDSYLSAKYTVPLYPVPRVINKLSVDFAIYNLYSRRMETIPETRATRHKDGVRLLEKIAEGKISIGEATEPTASGSNEAQVSTSSEDRIFTRDKLSGF
jgi:phage gp36-like protein